MKPDQLHFLLYVAGDGPNSTAAIANLKALCAKHFPNSASTEIIDVFKDPGAALAQGVMATPLLVVKVGDLSHRFIGDLGKAGAVLNALGITVESA